MSFLFANLRQHDPRRSGEVGVQAEHFDGERYLVDDTLTGGMPFGPKLQVFGSVIRSFPVHMVDVLIGAKRAAYSAGHYLSVFVDRLALPVDGNRANDPGIAVFAKMPSGFAIQKSLSGFAALVRDRARLRTKALIANVCAGMGPPGGLIDVKIASHRSDNPAFFACEIGTRSVPFGGRFTPAFSRAIHRVTAPPISVVAHAASEVGEWSSAMLAHKRDHFGHSALRMDSACIMSWSGGLRNVFAMPQVFAMENK